MSSHSFASPSQARNIHRAGCEWLLSLASDRPPQSEGFPPSPCTRPRPSGASPLLGLRVSSVVIRGLETCARTGWRVVASVARSLGSLPAVVRRPPAAMEALRVQLQVATAPPAGRQRPGVCAMRSTMPGLWRHVASLKGCLTGPLEPVVRCCAWGAHPHRGHSGSSGECSSHALVYALCGLRLHPRHHVRKRVQSHRDRAVSEALADHPGVHPGAQQHRRVRMP